MRIGRPILPLWNGFLNNATTPRPLPATTLSSQKLTLCFYKKKTYSFRRFAAVARHHCQKGYVSHSGRWYRKGKEASHTLCPSRSHLQTSLALRQRDTELSQWDRNSRWSDHFWAHWEENETLLWSDKWNICCKPKVGVGVERNV